MFSSGATLTKILNRRFVKIGLPLLVLVVGGSFYLEQFSQLRYTFGKKNSAIDREELKRLGFKLKKPEEITLEAEYEKLKSLDIDNWTQKRIPRPWEETAE